MVAPTAPRPAVTDGAHAEQHAGFVRYRFFERLLHWFVALNFIYLLLSGFALAYPRMAWLYPLLGGGQTARVMHPIVGVVLTVGVLVMLVAWAGQSTFSRRDVEWLKQLPTYAKTGHTGLDTSKYNSGQKGFFWAMILLTVGLLVTGIPLWFPDLFDSSGVLRAMRLVHHVLFLLFLAAFIIHVYLSSVAFPGTMSAMTTGSVSRAWAARHHPRWFREREAAQRAAGEPTATPDGTGVGHRSDDPR